VPEEASGLRQPRFWIRVFLLLDRLPAKANEPCLPTHTHTQTYTHIFICSSTNWYTESYQNLTLAGSGKCHMNYSI